MWGELRQEEGEKARKKVFAFSPDHLILEFIQVGTLGVRVESKNVWCCFCDNKHLMMDTHTQLLNLKYKMKLLE